MSDIDQYRNKILQGDCLEVLKTLPSNSIQLCVTSPPYYNLRNYQVEGQIGVEGSPELYVKKLVDVFREVKRVLRVDGTCWLNLGDSYARSGGWSSNDGLDGCKRGESGRAISNIQNGVNGQRKPTNLKEKDLMEIPSMVALALRADGWYLRSRLPWLKRNAMPSSVTDRPSSSVEYVFLLTTSPKYYYDAMAVRTKAKASSLARINQKSSNEQKGGEKDYGDTVRHDMSARTTIENFAANPGRNRRDGDSFFESWQGLYEEDDEPLGLVINPSGNKFMHFATYPQKLIEPCILAGTSERGACAICGAPYKRVVEKGEPLQEWKDKCGADSKGEYNGVSEKFLKQDALGKATQTGFNKRWKNKQQNASDVKRRILEGMVGTKTVSWEPTCNCYNSKQDGVDMGQTPQSFLRDNKIVLLRAKSREDAVRLYPDNIEKQKEHIKYVHDHGCTEDVKTVTWSSTCNCNITTTKPCIVLDPFMGSGTTAIVAQKFGRDYIGIELNPDYVVMAERRIKTAKEKMDEKPKSKPKPRSRFDDIGIQMNEKTNKNKTLGAF